MLGSNYHFYENYMFFYSWKKICLLRISIPVRFCSIYLFILSNKGWGGRLNERPELLVWVKRRKDQISSSGEKAYGSNSWSE